MTSYSYPAFSGGYHANMWHRIHYDIGIWPISSGFVSNQMVITFDRDLTVAEKTLLDAIMASSPGQPPVAVGTVFKVKDIWEFIDSFNTATTITLKVFYSESVPGSGKFDMIELHAASALTTNQKNKVASEYGKLII